MKRSARAVRRIIPSNFDLTSIAVRGGASMTEYAMLLIKVQLLAAQAYKSLGPTASQEALATLRPDQLAALANGKPPA